MINKPTNRDIDYVVPMVFPNDPEWKKDYRNTFAMNYAPNNYDACRFRSWNTEQLLINCIKTFMPFVRNIIIILARESQRQSWMDDEQIRVVYHSEFMPADKLPTFNSRAIEMYLPFIPGLSERFLYGNDDMFPLKPLQENNFFIGNVPCQYFRLMPFPKSPNSFHVACLNGLNFVGREFGLSFRDVWLKGGHSIAPILKETCLHFWEKYPNEMTDSVTPSRYVCNFNQYIYGWYQHFTGNFFYGPTMLNRTYLSVKMQMDEIRNAIRKEDCGIVCINDNEEAKNIHQYADVVTEEIYNKLQNYKQSSL